MNRSSTLLIVIAFSFVGFVGTASFADIVHFNFEGTGGSGILASSELPPVDGGGSGGIMAGGVFVDTDTGELSMDFGWGSANGFTDLTSDVGLLNIHGATASSGADAWSESAGGLITLTGYNASLSEGRYTDSIFLTSTQIDELLEGRYYIHIHTATHAGGEARGYFTAIPEPGSFCFSAFVLAGMAFIRRRS